MDPIPSCPEARVEPSKNTRSRICRHVCAVAHTTVPGHGSTHLPRTHRVCLTEEPTEVLYCTRAKQQRIVGISGFTVRPPRARQESRASRAFTSAKIDAILALEPDLAIGFSDLQADIAAGLDQAWHRGLDQQPPLRGCDPRLRAHGWARMVGANAQAETYADGLQRHIDQVAKPPPRLPRRPKVYFEEWDEPQISAIRWVSELMRHRRRRRYLSRACAKRVSAATASSRTRSTSWPRAPDIIIGSWCGKKFRPERVAARDALAWRCLRCAMASCTRSSLRSSCSPGPRRSPTVWTPCTG